MIRGGNANNGLNCGLGYVNVNNGLSNANANIGCRVANWKKHFFGHSVATLKR